MGAHAPARPSRASPAPARARAWRTGFSRSSGRRGGGAGARGVACERGRERPGCLRGACASVGGVVRPSGARRWHPRTRAPAPMRARTLLLSSAAPAAGHPGRARGNFSARERAQVRDFFFFAAGARSCRSLPRCPWAAGGAGVEGVVFPLFTPLPSFCCGYWSWKKKGVAGGAAGCSRRNSLARQPRALPSHSPCAHSRALATALPQTGTV